MPISHKVEGSISVLPHDIGNIGGYNIGTCTFLLLLNGGPSELVTSTQVENDGHCELQ